MMHHFKYMEKEYISKNMLKLLSPPLLMHVNKK